MDTLKLLASLQTQATDNHNALVAAVNSGFASVAATISEHTLDDSERFAALDKRLAPVEGMRRTLRWAAGAAFIQFLALVSLLAAYALHLKG